MGPAWQTRALGFQLVASLLLLVSLLLSATSGKHRGGLIAVLIL